jgi:hypothetical protein
MDEDVNPEIVASVQVALCDDRQQLIELIKARGNNPFEWSIPQNCYPDDREDYERKHGKFEEPLDPKLDKVWEQYVIDLNYEVENCEWQDIWNFIRKEWTSYPGEDIDYELESDRRGDTYTLVRFEGKKLPDGRDLHLYPDPDYPDSDPLDPFTLEELRKLYVWLVGFDRVMTDEWLTDEITYRMLFQRARWEETYEPEEEDEDPETEEEDEDDHAVCPGLHGA